MAKFIQDYHTGDFINVDRITRFKRRRDGEYVALDADGKEVATMFDFDVVSLVDRGTVVPAAPGTRAVVLRCLVDWREERLTMTDIDAQEHDVIAWRVGQVARPVFATAFGVDDEKVLLKMPDGGLVDLPEELSVMLDAAKADYLAEAQHNYDLNHSRPEGWGVH